MFLAMVQINHSRSVPRRIKPVTHAERLFCCWCFFSNARGCCLVSLTHDDPSRVLPPQDPAKSMETSPKLSDPID